MPQNCRSDCVLGMLRFGARERTFQIFLQIFLNYFVVLLTRSMTGSLRHQRQQNTFNCSPFVTHSVDRSYPTNILASCLPPSSQWYQRRSKTAFSVQFQPKSKPMRSWSNAMYHATRCTSWKGIQCQFHTFLLPFVHAICYERVCEQCMGCVISLLPWGWTRQ